MHYTLHTLPPIHYTLYTTHTSHYTPHTSHNTLHRYLKNVKLNRHHYIGFAASNGYQSINYVDPDFGNSALHYSVKMGHVNTTEELLKYSADMDCINRSVVCIV